MYDVVGLTPRSFPRGLVVVRGSRVRCNDRWQRVAPSPVVGDTVLHHITARLTVRMHPETRCQLRHLTVANVVATKMTSGKKMAMC